MAHVSFFLIAAVAVAAALGLVVKKNPIHGALFLVVNLAAVAALYLTLEAELLAAVHVIVYAGAIVVLFVFAIMVLIPGREETTEDPRRAYRVLAVPVGVLLLGLLTGVVTGRVAARPPAPAPPDGVEGVARVLFTDYLLPFELVGVLLLAAMVGVLVLARRRA
jgi:NADH-quinone oxidoreductase subunit J